MRIGTGILSALLTTLICLYPGLVVEDVLSALAVGAVLSFFLGIFLYSSSNSITDSSIDGKAILAANLVASSISSVVVSNGLWQGIWLTGSTTLLAMISGAILIFLSVRVTTKSNREAFELLDRWFQSRTNDEDGDR
jgi:hypothetical protein